MGVQRKDALYSDSVLLKPPHHHRLCTGVTLLTIDGAPPAVQPERNPVRNPSRSAQQRLTHRAPSEQ